MKWIATLDQDISWGVWIYHTICVFGVFWHFALSSCSVVFSCVSILLYMTNHIIRAFGVVCILHCAVVSAGYLYRQHAFGAHSKLTDYMWLCPPGRACATGLNDKMDHVWYSLDPRHAAPRASVIFFGGDSKFLIPSLNHKTSSPSLP